MQSLGLNATKLAAYHRRLFSSHDFRIHVDILDLNEKPKGSAVLLDGQVNIQQGSQIRRTASLTVSDPAGALDFSGASQWSTGAVWVDRLVRVRHSIVVPNVGTVTATPFIGVPSTISRDGAEVSLELQDKAALAVRGSKPYQVRKGANAVQAIKSILANCTGEFRFRLPSSSKRLSADYAVGWDDEVSPWAIATKIAKRDLGMELLYSCDGYATLRVRPTSVAIVVPGLTAQAAMSTDFTGLANYVTVAGKTTSKTTSTTKNGVTTKVTTTSQPTATAQTSGSAPTTPGALARNGVPRYLPLVVSDSAITTVAQAKTRATNELSAADRVQAAPEFSCVPFFHADAGDLVKVGGLSVRFDSGSIPLGVSGDMTIGATRWVSASPKIRAKGTKRRTRKVTRKRSKRRSTRHHSRHK